MSVTYTLPLHPDDVGPELPFWHLRFDLNSAAFLSADWRDILDVNTHSGLIPVVAARGMQVDSWGEESSDLACLLVEH